MRSHHSEGKPHAPQLLGQVDQRHAEFAEFAESAKREQAIQANLKGLGYGG